MSNAMSSPVLAVHNLTLATDDTMLVDNFSWQVKTGQFWCVVGKNGAGKSTLLQCIAGLHPPRHGRISANGQDIAALSVKEQARWRGLLLQMQSDVFADNVIDSVLTGRYSYQTGWGWESEEDIALAQQALQQVKLAGYDKKNILHLSGGERQRVALAAVLVQNPTLFLLDEPTAHQDVAAQIVMMDLIRDLSQTHAVVAVCHDINLVARYATHVLVIAKQQCYAGPVADVLTPSILQAAFDCNFDMINTESGILYVPVLPRQIS